MDRIILGTGIATVVLTAWVVVLMYRREPVISVLQHRWAATLAEDSVFIAGGVLYHRLFAKEHVKITCRMNGKTVIATAIHTEPEPVHRNIHLHIPTQASEETIAYLAKIPEGMKPPRKIEVTVDIRLTDGAKIRKKFPLTVEDFDELMQHGHGG